ncbi:hypothetical protein EON65_36485 [archaeon]|nr:MAG: hypothetical protein EON65_36485 [archaeon]
MLISSLYVAVENNVPIYKVAQERGTFIITLPKSFHCGFSYGVCAVL